MLTAQQSKIREFIQRWWHISGTSPTLADIAAAFSLTVGTVHEHVANLVELGVVTKVNRRIMPVGRCPLCGRKIRCPKKAASPQRS